MLKRLGIATLAWLASVIAAAVTGVVLQTQNVIARLDGIGADVGLGERLSMTAYDIQHLGSLYGIFIGLAFIVAWLAAAGVFRLFQFGRTFIYMVAGAVAILVMLFLMKQAFFDIHIIAGARNAIGIMMQMLAGALGGYVFTRVVKAPR